MKRGFRISLFAMLLCGLTLAVNSQCNTDQHSNHTTDSWQSCSASELPDGSGETGHWILYDLGAEYYISDLHYWNYNVYGSTENGFRDLEIRTSLDYTTWENDGTYLLEQALANNHYLGKPLQLDGIKARYVLLIAKSNFGGDCYGISEIRFNLGLEPVSSGLADEEVSKGFVLYPNPSNGHFRVDLRDINATHLNVIDIFGRVVSRKNIDGEISTSVKLNQQPSGTYFVQIIDGKSVRTEKILVK